MEANPEACEAAVEKSLSMVTGLNPYIGYEQAAALAKEAFKTGKTIRELCREKHVLPEDQLQRGPRPLAHDSPELIARSVERVSRCLIPLGGLFMCAELSSQQKNPGRAKRPGFLGGRETVSSWPVTGLRRRDRKRRSVRCLRYPASSGAETPGN